MSKIDARHRYLIRRNIDGAYVGSTDDLGAPIPTGHAMIDTKGEDNLGTANGSYGIADFLKAKKEGRQP